VGFASIKQKLQSKTKEAGDELKAMKEQVSPPCTPGKKEIILYSVS
jgi:hypothetical protein